MASAFYMSLTYCLVFFALHLSFTYAVSPYKPYRYPALEQDGQSLVFNDYLRKNPIVSSRRTRSPRRTACRLMFAVQLPTSFVAARLSLSRRETSGGRRSRAAVALQLAQARLPAGDSIEQTHALLLSRRQLFRLNGDAHRRARIVRRARERVSFSCSERISLEIILRRGRKSRRRRF